MLESEKRRLKKSRRWAYTLGVGLLLVFFVVVGFNSPGCTAHRAEVAAAHKLERDFLGSMKIVRVCPGTEGYGRFVQRDYNDALWISYYATPSLTDLAPVAPGIELKDVC